MKIILPFLKEYKKESILAPLFKMLEAILELFVPLVVAAVIDRGIHDQNKSYIFLLCGLLFVLAAVGLGFSITAQYFAAKAAVGTATGLRSRLFAHILSFGYKEMDDVGSDTLITRMTSDINQLQNGINMVLRLFLRSPFVVFGAMVMAFTIDVREALIFVVVIPILFLVVFFLIAVTRPVYKKIQESLDRVLTITRENLTGVRVIRAFHREKREEEEFFRANENLTRRNKFAGWISGLTNPVTFVIINFSIILLLYTGAVRVNSGSLQQGEVVALYNYMSQILIEVIKFSNLIVTMSKALASMHRIEDVFAITPAMEEGSADIGCMKSNQEENSPERCRFRSEKGEKEKAAVEFRRVSFRYHEGGEEAISDISFRAAPGEIIGIIGGTGSGKSTLVNLIPRFYDAEKGEVYLFGKNVKEYSYAALRKTIAVVPQKAQLFSGTIRSNLTLGCPMASQEEIEEALSIAQAKEFVEQKPKKLDAMVEQGGRNLSGGQKQRLALARALLMKAPVLIMDDSASALDYATDARLRAAIQNMSEKPTVFLVSQRTSSLQHADQILVLDDGKMIATGTHEELLDHCTIYREIYETQCSEEAQS